MLLYILRPDYFAASSRESGESSRLSPLSIPRLATEYSKRENKLRRNMKLERVDLVAAYPVVDMIDRVRDVGHERVEMIHAAPLPPLARGHLGPHLVGCLRLATRPNIRRRALNHIQVLSPLRHLGDDLHSRRTGTNDGNPLVAQLDHVRLLLRASDEPPVPARRVQDGLALAELVKAWKVGDVRRREGPCGVHDELGAQGDVLRFAARPALLGHAYDPPGRCLVPDLFLDDGREQAGDSEVGSCALVLAADLSAIGAGLGLLVLR